MGKGTYGSQKGRPPKKKMKHGAMAHGKKNMMGGGMKKKKMMMGMGGIPDMGMMGSTNKVEGISDLPPLKEPVELSLIEWDKIQKLSSEQYEEDGFSFVGAFSITLSYCMRLLHEID